MRYWDASAVVPLVIDEPGTSLVRDWLAEDAEVFTWVLTRVELTSAVERRAREGRITAADRRRALRAFRELGDAWDEVADVLAVRARAGVLLARHPLRAADAVQLAAALLVSGEEPHRLPFVCLDRRLADAADREGFHVLTWPDEDPATPHG